MELLTLSLEFLKVGLFSIGGGMATLPFLADIAARQPWFSQEQLIDMIAISESTPGPIGINIATFAGYSAGGVWGGIIASICLIIPSVLIALVLANVLNKFKNNKYLTAGFYGLRPAVTALIAFAAYGIIIITFFNFPLYQQTGNFLDLFNIISCVIFIVLFIFSRRIKIHPVFYIAIAAVLGIIFKL